LYGILKFEGEKMKNTLNARNLGLSGGILWGASMLVLTWVALLTGYSRGFLVSIIALYPGYSISWLGGVIGMVWGFVDAFLGLWLLAVIYNKLQKA
jgi:hypothetical protein